MSTYPFREVEEKQRAAWAAQPPAQRPSDSPKHLIYSFPVPVGTGDLSYSSLRRFIIADVHARLQGLQGTAVRLGTSWNGFAAGVEACARVAQVRPLELVERERSVFSKVLRELAVSLDPEAEIDLHRPESCRWAQWLFIQLHRHRLVSWKRSRPPAVAGEAGHPAPERPRAPERRSGSWRLDLSHFGDRLLNDLDRTNWPIPEKKDQRHRIGRRRGCEVLFQVSHAFRMEVEELPVFTTQVEAIYGATFILIHPDHPELSAVLDPSYEEDVARYRDRLARGAEPRISGARTGGFALNPANLKRIPVLVSALAKDPFFGGAAMGIPAHDPDQFELAKRLCLPIREAIRGPGSRYDVKGALKEAWTGEGTLTNSSIFSGLPVRVARERIIGYLGRRGIAQRVTRFRLQDVPISVPGVWGAPVPMIHCPRCGEVTIPEESLPLSLPAHSPPGPPEGAAGQPADLRSLPGYSRTACPICSGPAERDPQILAPWLIESLACFLNAGGPPVLEAAPPRGTMKEQPRGGEAVAPAEPSPAGSAEVGDSVGSGTGEAPGGREFSPDAPMAQDPLEAGLTPSGESGPPRQRADGVVPATDAGGSRSGDREAASPSGEGVPAPVPFPSSPPEGAEEAAFSPPDRPEEEILPEDRELFPDLPPPEPRGGRGGKGSAFRSARDGDHGYEPERPSMGEEEPSRGKGGERPAEVAEAVEGGEEPEEDEDDDESAALPAVVESRFHPFRTEEVRRWLPVDAAFARPQEKVLFLLCQRSIAKFLNGIGEIEVPEPFLRYLRSGKVEARPTAPSPLALPSPSVSEGKFPKGTAALSPPGPSRGTAKPGAPESARGLPGPVEAMERYGSDAVRIALLGLSAPHRSGYLDARLLWSAKRFLDRIFRQVTLRIERGKFVSRAVLEAKHRLIHNTTQRLRRFKFHTAVSALHEFLNFLESPSTTPEEMDRSALRSFLIVLWPFAPHLADDLWTRLGQAGSIRSDEWPEANKEILRSPEREIPVRIAGRLCRRIRVPAGLEKEKLEAAAVKDEKVQEALAGRPVGKIYSVVDRVVNILIEPPAPPAGAEAAAPGGQPEPAAPSPAKPGNPPPLGATG